MLWRCVGDLRSMEYRVHKGFRFRFLKGNIGVI